MSSRSLREPYGMPLFVCLSAGHIKTGQALEATHQQQEQREGGQEAGGPAGQGQQLHEVADGWEGWQNEVH